MNWEIIFEYRNIFLQGALTTLKITAIAILIGSILGLFLGLARMSVSRWLRVPAYIYVDFIRGTPLLVQIMIIHAALIPSIFGHSLGAMISGVVALSLNSAAYIAEIFRGGIQSIDRGQMEAARSLGLNHSQAMKFVILPQAFRRILPPLGNEFIALLKDSSLLMSISVAELMMAGKVVSGSYMVTWEAYLPVAALYLIMTLVLSQVVQYMERRLVTEKLS